MNKIYSVFLLSIFGWSSASQSQEIMYGLRAGYNYNSISGTIASSSAFASLETGTSYSVGLASSWDLSNGEMALPFEFQADIEWMRLQLEGTSSSRFIPYFRAPLILRYVSGTLSIGGGGYGSLGFGKVSSTSAGTNTLETFDEVSLEKLDYGAVATFGYRIKSEDPAGGAFGIDARLYAGSKDIDKSTNIVTTKSLEISLVYFFY